MTAASDRKAGVAARTAADLDTAPARPHRIVPELPRTRRLCPARFAREFIEREALAALPASLLAGIAGVWT